MTQIKIKVSAQDSKHVIKVTDVDTGAVSSFFSEDIVTGLRMALSWMEIVADFDTDDSVKKITKSLKKAKDYSGQDCSVDLGVKV